MTDDSIAFLFSLERLGMKFGLANMTRLCEALDPAERQTFNTLSDRLFARAEALRL